MKRWIWLPLLAALLLSACRVNEPAVLPAESSTHTETVLPAMTLPDPTKETEAVFCQLIAEAEDRAEAEKIAQLYGIELMEYRSGLATYYTEEEPNRVIARREPDWPELYRNYIAKAS